MLQDEALYFLRIGTFLERADNTARLLDVKFQALGGGDYFGPDSSKEQQEVDFYHWSAILRSVSGFEICRKFYRNVIHPNALVPKAHHTSASTEVCRAPSVAQLRSIPTDHERTR